MSPPWMPLYVADYLADTSHLSAAEHGAYLLLIMQYWQKGGLPNDDRQLARIARMTDRAWAAAKPILQGFFVDGWRHARIEKELAKSAEKSERRSAAGKEGGFRKHQRSKKDSIAGSNASSNELASSSQPQPEDTSLRSVSARKARPKSVRSQITEDAQPTSADRDHATGVGMSSDVFRFEWGRFRDHHLKVASSFASWPAAWRTWCANWLERGGARRARAGPTSDPIEEVRRRLRSNGHGRGHDEDDRTGTGAAEPRAASSDRRSAEQDRGRRDDERWPGPMLDLVAERPH